MTSIIIGYGQIGKAVKEVIGEAGIVDEGFPEPEKAHILHICFPYSKDFIKEVKRYIELCEPEHVIIYSTVPIGTTKQLPFAVHSPVEGKHPALGESIRRMPRWIGANSKFHGDFFKDYFAELGLAVNLLESSDHTEALKLLSTAEYGINIVFADYKNEIAKELDMDYSLMKDWNRDYNQLYQDLELLQYQRYVLNPPEGKIGGHCIRENSVLLSEQFPSPFLDLINEMRQP